MRGLREEGGARGRIRGAFRSLGRLAGRAFCPEAPDMAVHRFAAIVAAGHGTDERRQALVHLAGRVADAARVELEVPEGPDQHPRIVARWPLEAVGERAVPAQTVCLGPPLSVPIELAGRRGGTLRLWSRRALWSRDAIRRVTTLAVLAAAAEAHACVLRHEIPGMHDAQSGAHSLPYFTACLTHALALSRRRGVPLSLICIQIDPVRDGEAPVPDGIAAATLHHLTRAMTASLRSSDVIARIADQQLAALLPDTSMANASHVAQTLRRVLSEAWLTTGAIPGLCATLGIASYPDAAHEPGPLLAAAREALARAQANGPGRIACASPRARPHESAILAGCG